MKGVIPTRADVGKFVNKLIPSVDSIRSGRDLFGSEAQTVEDMSTIRFYIYVVGTGGGRVQPN
jgi:hypothetical protein